MWKRIKAWWRRFWNKQIVITINDAPDEPVLREPKKRLAAWDDYVM